MNRQAFAAIEVLLIDGNNLLHRLAGSADPAALRGLLPRLAAAIPENIAATVMLDGHSAPGSGRSQRVRRGLEIRHAGSRSADEALLDLVRAAPRGTTLVSDDRALRDKAQHLGAHTERLAWLEDLLRQGSGGSVGSVGIGGGGRPTRSIEPEPETEIERQPWRPGRGATKKRGNPRRQAH
jgi:hypothetical protein